MRSYRRLILLGVFLAVGVGLAISVATSTAPSVADDAGSVPSSGESGVSNEQVRPVITAGAPERGEKAAVWQSRAGRAGPVLAQANPALAEDQSGAEAPLTSFPEIIQKWVGKQNHREGAGGDEATQAGQASQADPSAAPTGPMPKHAPPVPAGVMPGAGAAQGGSPLAADLPTASSSPAAVQSKEKASRPNNTIRRAPGAAGDRFDINIRDADIREVLDLLSKEGYLNILASPKVQGKVSATLSDVQLESALAAILKSTGFISKREGNYLYVGSPEDFELMSQVADKVSTRIYHPNYVTSAELKNLISPILTPEVGIISVTTEAGSGIPEEMTDLGGDNYAGGDALLVRDYEAVLCEVDRLVGEVDRRPLQVHIETMILSVELDDNNKFGVNFQFLRQNNHMKFGWGTMPATLAEVKFDGGLKFAFLDQTLGTFINALETVGDTNVIATPRLMVLNKHAAVIQIGESKGYVNTTQTETAATQTVEFLDLGTLLRIRPFVSNDGMIRLEVHPEISEGDVDVKEGFTLPNKKVTQVTTNVMVRDGCTAVIGGLIQDKQEADRTQLPLLGSLPVVGVVFRESDQDLKRHELIVLLTPSVVRERPMYREGNLQACEYQRRHATYAEKMSPLSKRSLCRRYMRMAKEAWAQGNRKRALRMAELAVHFDAINREAIELRSDIWMGKPYGPPSQLDPNGAPTNNPFKGPMLPPWVLEQLGQTAAPRAGGAMPPGQPPIRNPAPLGRLEGIGVGPDSGATVIPGSSAVTDMESGVSPTVIATPPPEAVRPGMPPATLEPLMPGSASGQPSGR